MEKLTKLQKQEVRENLERIEDVLNQNEEWEEEYYNYSLTLYKNNILFDISDDIEDIENYEIELIEFDIKSILKSIITFLYENEINFRQSYIKETKNFNNRKIKSLALWSSRDKEEKVKQINLDLVERYNTTQTYKNEIDTYKSYVGDLYCCMWQLCPNWKVEDISTYVRNKLQEININNVGITTGENKIIVNVKNKEFEIGIDSYTRKEEVYTIIRNKID